MTRLCTLVGLYAGDKDAMSHEEAVRPVPCAVCKNQIHSIKNNTAFE